MAEITVGTLLNEKNETLKLSLLSGAEGLCRKITVSDINRPGLALSGFFEHFPAERLQIIGLAEYIYLKTLSHERQVEVLTKLLSYQRLPCVILTHSLEPLPSMLQVHAQCVCPLLHSKFTPSQLMAELIFYLENKMAKTTQVHGVLVNVYGLGVLILGNAGIGKSECALELMKRGHMFVADDVVELRQLSGGVIIGKSQEIIQHHIEVRGMGIIDVKNMFSIGFILDESKIELVVRLQDWDGTHNYDRVGLDDRFTTLLDVNIPEVVFPVKPGRNLAILIEMASLNQRLKKKGFNPAKELNEKLIDIMAKQNGDKK